MNKVHLIDCMEFMKDIPDKYYELAIVDPPYGIGADNPSVKNSWVKQKNGNKIYVNGKTYKHKDWDSSIPSEEYFKELKRISKNQIIWGVNYYPYNGLTGGRIVWNKLNGESDQFGCEIAYNSLNYRTDVVNFMWRGMFQGVYCGLDIKKAILQQGNKSLNEPRFHPTQKPVALYKWLLKNYAKPGDKIFDSHVGSGSIRIACHDMGFDFEGCEIDKDYWEAQEKRYNQHAMQGDLFSDEDTQKAIYQGGLF
jgi:site-specific DNA-methyltransferase (adenine-specific)